MYTFVDEYEPQEICPYCGEDRITDWDLDHEGDSFTYWATCPKCGKGWGINYTLAFVCNIVEDN